MTLLVWLTIFWIGGIALARWLTPSPLALAFLAIPVVGVLLLYSNSSRGRRLGLAGLAMLLGATRLWLSTPAITANHIAYYNDNGPLLLTGAIVDEPDVRDTYTNYRVAAEKITLANDTTHPVDGLVLVRGNRYPTYHFGDQLEIWAAPETPPVFDTFSYKDYLARFGIHTLMRRPRIKLLAQADGFSLRGAIYTIKAQAHQTINQILPAPQSALLNGILLGIETEIPETLYDQFNITGTSHVIVISGSNISLVVALLLLLGTRLLGKRNASILAVVGVVAYTIMVGADAAVVRAALMGIVFVIAMYLGRPNVVLNALFFSALAMTIHNPLVLWDVGFQLSFLATLGLIVLVPPLERAFSRLPGGLSQTFVGGFISEAVLVTLAAQIITTPLILYQFQRLSVVSLLSNFLIVPVQPLVMLFGGAATMAGMIAQPLGQVVGWLAWLPLTWTIKVVQWSAAFPWAQLVLPAMPTWLLVLLYIALGVGVWAVNLKHDDEYRPLAAIQQPLGRWSWGVGAGLAVLLLGWFAWQALPDGNLHVDFLDVGQGDAILITTPSGRQVLIDGGESPAILAERLGEIMPFWDRSLDVVINTHPDSDHLGGLPPLLNRYQIEQVLVSDAAGTSSLYREWERQLTNHNATVVTAEAGSTLALDDSVSALVVNPGDASARDDSPNNHSVTLLLRMGQVSFLLPGDIEAEIEAGLLPAFDLQATVLKSPHHGSKTSSSAPFLAEVNPQIIVISVGADNRFGHPHQDVLARYQDLGATILRTDELGTVSLVTDGEALWWEQGR